MISSTIYKIALLSCASFITHVSCSDQLPLDHSIVLPVTAADPEVLKHFRSSFHNWSHVAGQNALLRHPHVLCWGCTIRGSCCPNGGPLMPPPPDGPPEGATTSSPLTQPTLTGDGAAVAVTVTVTQSTPTLPASTPWEPFALPTTLSNIFPTRTTLFRQPINSIESNVAAKLQAPHQSDNNDDHEDLRDITSTYYDYTIEGHHPFQVPLILLDSEQTPITAFAFANISQDLSFISHDLLEQVGRTSEITHKQSGLSSQELSRMLGFETASPGIVSLDILAGKDDGHYKSVEFVVFNPTNDARGELNIDLSVGMNFLRDANAVRLDNNFVGVGAKEGLGIVVQRVYLDRGEQTVNQADHDEL